MISIGWTSLLLIVSLYISNDQLTENSVALQPAMTYCLIDFASRDSLVIMALITIVVFLSVPLFFMIFAYSQIILFYRKMNRSREYITSEVKSIVTLLIILLGLQIREKVIDQGDCNHIRLFYNVYF